MTFWLKKLISAFLFPLPIGLLGIMLGILLLLLGRAQRFGKTALASGFLIIFIFSLNPVSYALLDQLQLQYTPLIKTPEGVTQVVVLGGGISGGKNYPPNLTLGSASLSRLVEGVRLFKELYKHNTEAQLILSGGRVFRSPTIAGKMRNTALMLGVNEGNTLLEDGSLDTHQEAMYLQKILGKKPFILVTSAYHMPRSIALFEQVGMHPIAAPTQFINFHDSPSTWLVPSAYALTLTDIALHEYIGMLWAKFKGYIKH